MLFGVLLLFDVWTQVYPAKADPVTVTGESMFP